MEAAETKPSAGSSPKPSPAREELFEEPPSGLFDPLIVAPTTGVNALNQARAGVSLACTKCLWLQAGESCNNALLCMCGAWTLSRWQYNNMTCCLKCVLPAKAPFCGADHG